MTLRNSSEHSPTAFGYSPALDGLRAFAVLSVVLFHAGVGGISGGFLGVDAFFVLSGFLITSLLLAEHVRHGRIKLSRFWARRARRLMPALLAMLLATAVAGHFLLDSDDLKLLRGDGLAAIAYVANWRMIWRGTGYVAATATPSPLQHTWSLGIEEQFYVLWPLIIAGLAAWLAARRTRWVLLAACSAGAVASALLAVALYSPDSISRDYYGTDTRAQALLIGAALAAILAPTSDRPAPRHRAASRHVVLGALAIVGAATTLWMWHDVGDNDAWLYHGGLATALAVVLTTIPAPTPALSAAPVVVTSTKPQPSASKAGVYVPMARTDRTKGTSGSEPRITFFGDSVSWVIGKYLPRHPGLWTSVRAIEGCGIATLPDILELGMPHTNYPGCTNWPGRWEKGVNKDDPDVSVIELNRWELMDRKLNGTYQHVGDPAYNAYLLGQLDKAVTIAGSKGAAVVLLTAAYTHRAEKPDGSLYPEDTPARVDAWNRLLIQEQAKHPRTVTILNLNKLVCPNGKFTWAIGKLRIRSDGLHYTPAGVQQIIAPWLLPKLADIAKGTYKP